MDKKIKDILSHKLLILLLSVILLIFGVYSYIKIPKQEMPDIASIYGYIQITAPGLNPEEIEDNIAQPIHEVINEYSTVEGFTTTSLDNACVIVIEMNINNSDSQDTIEEIKTRVLSLDRHPNITDIKFITEIKTAQAIYAIHSDDLSEYELEVIADNLSSELANVTNVININVDSTYSEQVVVEIDYEILNDLPLTIEDVYSIIVASSIEIPLGNTKFNGESSSIIINSSYESLDDIEDIVLFTNEYGVYKISDIADVRLENTEKKKTYEFASQTAVFVEVFFEDDIDFTVIGDELSTAVDNFASRLPDNVSITSMTFSPEYVKNQVSQVMINLAECIAIVMLVVLVGLGIRNSLAIAITIPVIVLTTISILYLLGNELELMSIAGLIVSIGILVDNSIVISEAAQHNIDQGYGNKLGCHKAVRDNWVPVLSSTLTTVAAFVPLLILPGIAGEVAYSLPLTILTAIVLSYLVAMTLTPTIARVFFKPKKSKKDKVIKENKVLRKILTFTFKLSILPVVIAFMLLATLTFLVVDRLDVDILPKTEACVVYIDYEYEDTDNDKSYKFAKEIEEVVIKQSDVVNYAFSQGGNLPRFYLTLGNISDFAQNGRFFIEYDCNSSELSNYMASLEDDLSPLLEFGEITVNRLELSQPSAPVVIVLTATDYEKLIATSDKIFSEITQLDSYKDGQLVAPEYKTDIVLDLDTESIALNGLTIVEVQQQISTHVNGIKESLYKSNDSMLDVKVITNIKDYTDLMDLNIKSSLGTFIKLEDIATLDEIDTLEYINLYDGTPSVSIDGYMANGYSTYDLENDILKIVDKYNHGEISVTKKGDNQITNELLSSIAMAFIIALFAIYLIMYFQFKSFVQPLIILMSIPLSCIGSLAALLLMNENITLTALLGLISLVGIVVNNGILLVEYINRSKKEGNSVEESCILSVNRRLRPILLSSLTTILGIVPLALFGGDFFRPLAVTFMGGLFTSTLLVIFIIPQLYYLSNKKREKIVKQS